MYEIRKHIVIHYDHREVALHRTVISEPVTYSSFCHSVAMSSGASQLHVKSMGAAILAVAAVI
jgi:hypothetical protein